MKHDDFTDLPVEEFPAIKAEEANAEIPEQAASQEAFYAATLSDSQEPIDDFTRTKENLQAYGEDVLSKAVRERLARDINIVSDEEALSVAATIPSSKERQDFITNYLTTRVGMADVDLQREYLVESGSAVVYRQKVKNDVQDSALAEIDNIIESRDDIARQAQEMALNSGKSDLELDADALALFIPFNYGNIYKNILEKLVDVDVLGKGTPQGEGSPSGALVLTGEALDIIKDELRAATPDQQRVIAKHIFKTIDENSGFLSNNDVIKSMVVREVFKEFLDPSSVGKFDTDRLILNVAGILDVVGVGQLAKAGFGLIRNIGKSSPAAAIINSDPDKASIVLTEALTNEKLSKTIGATPTEIVSQVVYPKPGNMGNIKAAPADIVKNIEELNAKMKNVVEIGEPVSINFRADEIAAAGRAWEKDLSTATEAHLFTGGTEIAIEGEKIKVNALYGMDAAQGFPTGLVARERALETIGEGKYDLLKVRGDKLQKVKNLSQGGEWFFRAKHERFLRPNDALSFEATDLFIEGTKAKFIADPATIFSTWFSGAGTIVQGLGKSVEHKLYNIIDKPFVRLGDVSRTKIVSLLDEGNRAGKRIDVETMQGMGFSSQEIKGVHSMYALSDSMYLLNNRKFFEAMDAKGFKKLSNSNNGWSSLGKGISEDSASSVKHVYDPNTDTVIQITKEEVAKLYAGGDRIAKLQSREGSVAEKATHAIIKKADKSTLEALPETLLNYKPGYIARFYKDEVFIDEITKVVVDGVAKDHIRTIASTGNKIAASKSVERMNASAPEGIKYEARRSREITEQLRNKKLQDVEKARGRMFSSKRGEQLAGLEGLAHIEDPIDAIIRSISATSRTVSHEGFVESAKQRFINTFGDLVDHKFPLDKELIASTTGRLKDTQRIEKAKAFHDYITLMSGVQPKSARLWKGFMSKIADDIENGNSGARDWMSTKVRQSDFDPMRAARGATFNMFLAASPARQLILQSAQFAFIASLAPKYVANAKFGGFLLQKKAMDLGMIINIGDIGVESAKVQKAGAKLMGVSEKEYVSILQDFKDSGLPFSIDSHLFSKDAILELNKNIQSTLVGKGVRAIVNAPKRIINTAKKVGFDFGEYNNLASTYLLARKLYLDRTGKTFTTLSRADKLKIGGEARQLSLNMTESGSFGYQKGILSLSTQFYSIQQKAFLAVLPGKFGNKAFTNAQKRRIAIGQTLLYGTAGFGVSEVYRQARDKFNIEVNPAVDQLIIGGLTDYLLNATINGTLDGTGDTNISISNDIAPASGVFNSGSEMLITMFNHPSPELFFGASYQAGGRLWKAGMLTKQILSTPDVSTPETLTRAVNASMSVFSGYNNYLKASAAFNIGFHVNNSGDPIVKATWQESVGQFGGFKPAAINEYYRWQNTIYGKGGSRPTDDIAKEYYKRTKAIVALYASEAPEDLTDLHFKRLEAALNTESMILAAVNDRDRDFILLEYRRLVNRGVSTGSDRLVNDLMISAVNGAYGNDIDNLLTQMINSGLVTDPVNQQALRDMWDYLVNTPRISEEQK